ncbi:CBS domain-containing protein [Streptomyces sp. HB132]|nr:CBS domain-containing protein [Streptomyces sp. HB132]
MRAFLWWRTGDRLRATVRATLAGRVLGWLLIAAGFLVFLKGGGLEGLWLALIGWFLIAAATAEGRQAQMRGLMAGVPVRDAMTRDPLTAPAALTVAEMLDDPRYRYRHSAFPVTTADRAPLGLMTLDRARQVPTGQSGSVTVGEAMIPLPQTTVAHPGDPLADLLPRMEPGAEHRVLVVDEGRLVGILTLSDISRTVAWLTSSARKP